ncbi:hypothetical protein [Peribacillus sp. SI8-4]|uniref:hypothetical protein n=1 Tax=Peribacillus sp. SI8-4 TaxID=3048009 RepID=UPI002554712A|nr:hypothetical protein [Peribacillus sp. SI8-4]
MLVFFMFLLFVLNICSIFAIIILYLRQNRLAKLEIDQKATISEMEQLLSGYLMEMKDDNEALIQALTETAGTDNRHLPKEWQGQDKDSIEEKEVNKDQDMPDGFKVENSAAFKRQALGAYKNKPAESEGRPLRLEVEDRMELSTDGHPPIVEGEQPGKDFADLLKSSMKEPSLDEQVDALVQQGHSLEEIAKKLGRGQTEIELLLKFRKNR